MNFIDGHEKFDSILIILPQKVHESRAR